MEHPITKKQYQLFKEAVLKTVEKLGLTEYSVYFRYKQLAKRVQAELKVEYPAYSSRFRLTKKHPDKTSDKEIEKIAKHEVAHLLIDRLMDLALSNNVPEKEVIEECEKIANRLERIL